MCVYKVKRVVVVQKWWFGRIDEGFKIKKKQKKERKKKEQDV